ncbi:zinc transporter ZIP5 isoform X2 [Emydura macquarii macquarii]|uniref:zinc transporter ZIP5 isoform X2 n=1 Tax=Emydura macquarii macquarii TaxID=1129001 RepID=UPI00352A9583
MEPWKPPLLLAGLWLAALLQPGPGQEQDREQGEAAQEQAHYLQQLFGLYGENGSLSAAGLTRLLARLGLGRVHVLQLEHEARGHGHVAHLEVLDLQGGEHRARAPAAQPENGTARPGAERRKGPGTGRTEPTPPPRPASRSPGPADTAGPSSSAAQGSRRDPGPPPPAQPGRSLLERVLGLDHPLSDHLHEDCLNVTQLLVNFGLSSVPTITPEQFALLCPALLYQIDSRVCVQHRGPGTLEPLGGPLWPALGWGCLAVTLLSLPSALALLLLPGLGRRRARRLLAFLAALAVGTLCGDALLHLWPHPRAAGGSPATDPDGSSGFALRELAPAGGAAPEAQRLTAPAGGGAEEGARADRRTEELGHHHGHGPGPAAGLAWMVILGDGIHNLVDGLAIGAAFSEGVSSGLSTTVAVFCHELPHELGDCAVLLQAGMPLRRLLLTNMASAALAYLGMALGTAASQSPWPITPWIFASTAGIFLYVALVDMLPEMLRQSSGKSGKGAVTYFALQNLGFLLGGTIMSCIAFFEGQMSFHVDL